MTINDQQSQMMGEIKNKMGKLTTSVGILQQEKGKFPTQCQANPQGQHFVSSSVIFLEQAKSIITLRSGKAVDNAIVVLPVTPILLPFPVPSKPSSTLRESPKQASAEKEKESDPIPQVSPILAPYPQRLRASPKPSSNAEVYGLFQQVKVNIPVVNAIKQKPSYPKFLKDLCTVKRKLNVQKKVFLTEQVSSIIQTDIALKYKDLGCPTISIVIGGKRIKALLDLGASVNLLPYSIYEQLGLREMKPTKVTLQLADYSIRIPCGMVENVLVQIDNFVYPVDFVVLDTCPVPVAQATTPIILKHPFLVTSEAVIHCRAGLLNMTFGNMKMEFNIFNANGGMGEKADDHAINMVDICFSLFVTVCGQPKEMDAEVDYLYSLLAKQDAYEPIFKELAPMEPKVVSSDLLYLDSSQQKLLLAHEMTMLETSSVYYEDPLENLSPLRKWRPKWITCSHCWLNKMLMNQSLKS
ncbi:uncharacterized protein LOC131332732 [Rhododendron vialii]|uniref:uncharacterized protein LOC131332732 n=1 Tax=Rhododendron vialii TaxID=182163 RepID=UPI00265EB23B|nr:uncharacterized protein LOC131332732 [Rhododendron vialii]